jgi:predicted nucleic acid-binding protein
MFYSGLITLCYDARIFFEYSQVLKRPKFAFEPRKLDLLLRSIRDDGHLITVHPSTIALSDESDRKFYDVARNCSAILITGNKRHYPSLSWIKNATEFLTAFG